MPWPAGIPAWLKNQWGVISAQVAARATTAAIIDSLRPYAAAAPGGWGPQGIIYVQQLRSIAVGIRNAADQVTRDDFTGTIQAHHISEAPWSRSPVQQQLAPRFMIRAFVEYTNPEFIMGLAGAPEKLQKWVTQYTDQLPGTLEQLSEDVIQQAGESGSPPTPVTNLARMEIIRE